VLARRWVSVTSLALGAAAAGFLLTTPGRGEAPAPFNHEIHTRSGMACTVCHTETATAPGTQSPSSDVCLRCHAGPPPRVEAAAWHAVASGKPIRWRRLTTVPAHVMFSHRRHVGVDGDHAVARASSTRRVHLVVAFPGELDA